MQNNMINDQTLRIIFSVILCMIAFNFSLDNNIYNNIFDFILGKLAITFFGGFIGLMLGITCVIARKYD